MHEPQMSSGVDRRMTEGSTTHILTRNIEEKLMRIDSEMNMIKIYLRKIREEDSRRTEGEVSK